MKYVDWPLCVVNASILIKGHRYASLYYCRKCRNVSVIFSCWECLLWVINVEGHAAHCRLASTAITIRVIKKQDRRTQHKMRIYTWSRIIRASRHDEATSHRRRQPRIDVLFFSVSKLAFLKPVFLACFRMRGPILTVELIIVFGDMYNKRAFWALCRRHNCELECLIRGPMLLYDLQIFPSWKRWVELKLLRAGHRRKGSTRSEIRKRKHALGW